MENVSLCLISKTQFVFNFSLSALDQSLLPTHRLTTANGQFADEPKRRRCLDFSLAGDFNYFNKYLMCQVLS